MRILSLAAAKTTGGLLIGLGTFAALALCVPGPAQAQQVNFLQALTPLQKWVAEDYPNALAVTGAYADLPDQTLAACLPDFKPVTNILHDHPLPFTLHPLTDLAYARQVIARFNAACHNPACAQVFQDMQNAAKLPFNFSSICHLVPIVDMVYPAPTPVAAPTPKPTASATPTSTPTPTPSATTP